VKPKIALVIAVMWAPGCGSPLDRVENASLALQKCVASQIRASQCQTARDDLETAILNAEKEGVTTQQLTATAQLVVRQTQSLDTGPVLALLQRWSEIDKEEIERRTAPDQIRENEMALREYAAKEMKADTSTLAAVCSGANSVASRAELCRLRQGGDFETFSVELEAMRLEWLRERH